jgi:glycosyltransferase involved in cell wall biosynthesis
MRTENLPKHVLMTTDTLGGVWTYSIELAGELSRAGIRVSLATMGCPLRREQMEEANAIPNLNIYESHFKLEWMDDPWKDVAAAGEWLLRLELMLEPDLIHLNNFVHGALPWRSPSLVVGHSCVLSWWSAVKHTSIPEKYFNYQKRVSQGLHAADLVVAPSLGMLRELNRHYIPFAHGLMIPNGRRPECFRPGRKQDFILSCGRIWDEAKNIAALHEIAPELEWPVCIAGQQIHPNGSAASMSNLVSLGQLSQQNLAGWYARASIYAMPARYEPFGLSILEAALSGSTLVLGDIASLRENWTDAAIFVPPDQPAELCDAINRLIHSGAERAEFATRAQVRAREFTSQRMASEYFRAYRLAAARFRQRAAVDYKERETPCVSYSSAIQ